METRGWVLVWKDRPHPFWLQVSTLPPGHPLNPNKGGPCKDNRFNRLDGAILLGPYYDDNYFTTHA